MGASEKDASEKDDIYDINNAGTITNLYNLQGTSTNPLTLKGNLPSNYYLVIDSEDDYGQLSVTSGSGSMNFSISDDSVIGVPDVSYTEHASSTPLVPLATTPYEVNAIGTEITIEATSDWTVSGPVHNITCLLYTSPSPRDRQKSRMPSSA